jgi:uncharacterized membrane protein YccC
MQYSKLPFYTAIVMATAGTIAFVIYNLLHLEFGYWSVITIAAVMQPSLANTYTKSFMRAIGTLIGALVGYIFALLAAGNVVLVLALFFIFIVFTSYAAIQKTKFDYLGVIAGLTMVIVLSSSLINNQLFDMAVYRSIDVLMGIFIVGITNWALWRYVHSSGENFRDFVENIRSFPHTVKSFHFTKKNLKIAVKIALACLFTFALWLYFRQPNGFWATVSCLLIMEESVDRTRLKSYFRFFAHVIAGLFGAFFAWVVGSHVWLLLIPLILSFSLCGYLIGQRNQYSALGNTMGIAIAIMLLTSPGTAATFEVITSRFLNVMLGISVGLFITMFLMPHKKENA